MDIRVKEAIKKTFLLYRQPIDKVIKKAHITEDLIKKDFMNDQQNTFNKKTTLKIVYWGFRSSREEEASGN